jgi:hypothetical protein
VSNRQNMHGLSGSRGKLAGKGGPTQHKGLF